MMTKRLTFEEARAKWLKELNGRDLAQYADDIEREHDEKVAKLMTPEYLAIWKKAAKETVAEGNCKG
ncbi:hypothetical protein G6662_07375 [Polynucleobacter paneuropaeus]|nr:hypothetical protein [Polynucleobacter paneuropaeus]